MKKTNNEFHYGYIVFALLSYTTPTLAEQLFDATHIQSIILRSLFLGMAAGWIGCFLYWKKFKKN